MKQQKLSKWIWLVASIQLLFVLPVRAEVKALTSQAQSQSTLVTAVELNQSRDGLEIVLKTSTGKNLVPLILPEGNNLIVEILDATLAPGIRNGVTRNNPAPGIKQVRVTKIDDSSIRLIITGETQAPRAEVIPSRQNLVLSVNPERNTAKKTPDEEIEVIATGEAENDDYLVPNTTTGTKLELPLRDIPQSIQVIPRQVIEDRQVTRLNELTDNVSGVQRVPGYGGVSSLGTRIRGFTTSFETLRNGFRDFGYLSPRDPANIERVEILKGPSSVLYGGGVVGFSGQVNTVTKKPQAEPRYEIGMVVGSYDFYRPTADFTGALTNDKSLLYRLNLAYENADSFRDFGENESYLIAPALTWQIGQKTKLSLELEQQHQEYFFDNGLPAEPEFLDLPRDRFVLGEPDLNNATWDSTSITHNFEHEFSDNWKFRQGFNMTTVDGGEDSSFPLPLESDRRTLPRDFERSEESQESYSLQNELFTKFKTGSINHDVLLGVELARYRFDYTFEVGEIDPIDIFNPVYGARPRNFLPGDRQAYGGDNLGIYIQDFVKIKPNLKLLVGGRVDFNDAYREQFDPEVEDIDKTNSDFSPRVGIVYQPGQDTSVYFNYSQSFAQLLPASRTNEEFKPATGEQFEIGVKQNLLNKKLFATLALYQITRQNVLTTDPVDANFQVATGEQRSRGVELDLAGEILPGWKAIANYAYTDAIVTEDNDIPEGQRLDGTPEHSAGLWTTYEMQKGSLQGLGFGLGLTFLGDREAQIPNTITCLLMYEPMPLFFIDKIITKLV